MSKILLNYLSKEILEYEYKNCGSMQKVADKLKLSVDTIYKYMKLYNIEYNINYKGLYSCNESFFNSGSPESFYLAGFIAADGSVQYRKYSKILKITLALKDENHLIKIKNILNSSHPIKKYLVKPSKLIQSEHECVELQIANKTIVDSLLKFNIVPNKTKKYNIADWIVDHQFVNHFIRGYFDGDGTITYCGLPKNRKIKQLNFSIIGTEKFIKQYNDILSKNCKINPAKVINHYSIYKISFSGNNVVKKIYNFLYQDASLYLDRKKNIFDNNYIATEALKLANGAETII
jgi:hypothetical protein